MKKLAYLIMLGVLLLAASCQVTPKNNIIVGKNDGVLEAALKAEADYDPLSIVYPERWEAEYEKFGGKFKMTINADVVVTNVKSYPVAEISTYYVPIEQATRFVETIFGKQEVYHVPMELTKEQLEKEVISIKAEIQEAENKGDLELKKNLESRLEWLISEYEGAPESVLKKPYLKEYNLYIEDGYEEQYLALREDPANINSPVLQITNIKNLNRNKNFKSEVTYGDYSIDPFPYYYDDETLIVKYEDHPVFKTEDAKQAIKTVKKFLKSVGIEDRVICDMYALTYTEGSRDIVGYEMIFARKFNDMVIMPNIQDGGTYGDIDISDADAFIEPFSSERLIIQIVDNEIILLDWTGMFDIIDTIHKNVKLLPFETIMANVKNQIATKYAYTESGQTAYKYYVDEIVLTYAIEPIKDSHGRYLLIPVWGFYGGIDCGDEGLVFSDGTVIKGKIRFVRSLLTINAIDGSVIYGGYEDHMN